jgi:HD superfamily phosphohydrolase
MKMHFFDHLRESQESKGFRNKNKQLKGIVIKHFEPLKYNVFTVSIQASAGNYCTPRESLEDVRQYKEMEFAVMHNNEFIRVSDILPTFTKLNEIEKHYKTVYAYVPVELIQELFEELNSVYK